MSRRIEIDFWYNSIHTSFDGNRHIICGLPAKQRVNPYQLFTTLFYVKNFCYQILRFTTVIAITEYKDYCLAIDDAGGVVFVEAVY